ncbi:hypothetical protein Tco_0633410 [Tanacetum coccineum]
METRKEKIQIPIPSPTRSHRKTLSLDKTLSQELTEIVSPSNATTSKVQHKTRHISSKYSHNPGVIHKMCRDQGYMIQHLEKKYVTDREFWKVYGNVDKVLYEIIPQNAEKAANDVIDGNLKRIMANTIIQERNALQAEMKSNPQDQVADQALLDVLKRKFEKSSTSNTSCRDDAFCPHHHDDHQEDDAPHKGEKRAKRHKTSKSSKSTRSSSSKKTTNEVISKDTTPELIDEFQNADKHILTIYNYTRMMATLNDMMSNQFKDTEGYTYHLEQTKNYTENQIVFGKADKMISNDQSHMLKITEVVRITIDQQHGLDYMEQIIVMRENDKPDSFSEADFKYLNKNDIEDLYYLCLNEKVNFCEIKLMNSLITFTRNCIICERVHDFQLGIESYQIRVNLTTPTITFPGIEAHDPYFNVDKLKTSLIYLTSKEEKRVMYLAQIVKFCDATLERDMNKVKLKIFKSEPWKKPHMLGD